MQGKLRISTFNLENLDDKPDQSPSLNDRIAVMRPQLLRLNADIICLQEVNGQEETCQPRRLLALDKLLQSTKYGNYNRISTMTADGSQVYDERNLVILSRFNILEHQQIKHQYAQPPAYRKVTAQDGDNEADEVTWERPILYAKIDIGDNEILHVINLHLKSRLPSNIPGQKINNYTWKTVAGWAEGYFLSSMKRVGQALEARVFIDNIFNDDEAAGIVVCGDFNADFDNVPVEAIIGEVENTGNGKLSTRTMIPCERTIPEPSRFSLYHRGQKNMLDHLLASRSMIAYYNGAEIHNEVLHDESIAFATDKKFPESDHAPVTAEFIF